MIEIICSIIGFILYLVFLEIIASSGEALNKSYWDDPNDNFVNNIARYLREKEEERKRKHDR